MFFIFAFIFMVALAIHFGFIGTLLWTIFIGFIVFFVLAFIAHV